MRVTFLGHASHLVELDGLRVLTDPWLVDPIFDGLAEHDLALPFGARDLPAVDAIVLSHAHLDHFNAPTLSLLDRSVPVIHPKVRFSELDTNLGRLGFNNLHPLADYEAFELDRLRVVSTPSQGVLDECAYMIEGTSGRFWNGVDAPQPPDVVAEIARRFGEIDLGALSHNSFDMPALLGLASIKETDHGPEEAAQAAKRLGITAAIAAASNMRWRGPNGGDITRRVIRQGPGDLRRRLTHVAPEVALLDLGPGDAWSREGGIERGTFTGSPETHQGSDFLHAFLQTGERFTEATEPATEDLFRRDLPARLATVPAASLHVGQELFFEIEGSDPGSYTVDFRSPGTIPKQGDTGAAYGLRVLDSDWKALFERRLPWQVLLASDRVRVTRVRHGPPPDGLHFAFALQAVFP